MPIAEHCLIFCRRRRKIFGGGGGERRKVGKIFVGVKEFQQEMGKKSLTSKKKDIK